MRSPRARRPAALLARVALVVAASVGFSGCAQQGISIKSHDVHVLYLVIMALAAPVVIGVYAALA